MAQALVIGTISGALISLAFTAARVRHAHPDVQRIVVSAGGLLGAAAGAIAAAHLVLLLAP